MSVRNECIVLLTTHSSAVIDLLSHDEDSQIIHVTHDGTKAKSRHVSTYYDNRGVLDDLDIRASDLLQANGIIWVEGPSDRLYFNRWIDLCTDGALQEGAHYQCVFYGGRLLAHLSGEAPFEDASPSELVKIFGVNRNAIVIMDSDKNADDSEIGETKKRIATEVTSFGGIAWITAGREIENYIPPETLGRMYPDVRVVLGQYEDFASFLDRIRDGEGKKFERNKALFTERVLPSLLTEDLLIRVDGKFAPRPNLTLNPAARVLEASRQIARWKSYRRILVTGGVRRQRFELAM